MPQQNCDIRIPGLPKLPLDDTSKWVLAEMISALPPLDSGEVSSFVSIAKDRVLSLAGQDESCLKKALSTLLNTDLTLCVGEGLDTTFRLVRTAWNDQVEGREVLIYAFDREVVSFLVGETPEQ